MRISNIISLLVAVVLSLPAAHAELMSADRVDVGGLTVEYFTDYDPGVGKAKSLAAEEGRNQYAIPFGDFAEGAHIFGVRAISAAGMVSPTVTYPVYIADEQLYNDLEYFVDNDPGEGKGNRLDHHFAKIVHFVVGTDNLSLGTHTMNVRVKGDNGKWSAVMTRPFIVVEKIADLDYVVEYFYDKDPGFGNGHQIAAAEGRNSFFLPLESDLSPGAHLFGVRCRDKDGSWSITEVSPLFIMPVVSLERVEYYVDNDPGEGFANAVAVDDSGKASFAIRTSDLSFGGHRLNLRGMDYEGEWHDLFSREFTVKETGGVEDVAWSAGLRLSMSDGDLTVLPSGLSDGTLVEVFTLDGKLINRTRWENTENALHINVGRQSCLIVRAIGPDGYYCVDTIR